MRACVIIIVVHRIIIVQMIRSLTLTSKRKITTIIEICITRFNAKVILLFELVWLNESNLIKCLLLSKVQVIKINYNGQENNGWLDDFFFVCFQENANNLNLYSVLTWDLSIYLCKTYPYGIYRQRKKPQHDLLLAVYIRKRKFNFSASEISMIYVTYRNVHVFTCYVTVKTWYVLISILFLLGKSKSH